MATPDRRLGGRVLPHPRPSLVLPALLHGNSPGAQLLPHLAAPPLAKPMATRALPRELQLCPMGIGMAYPANDADLLRHLSIRRRLRHPCVDSSWRSLEKVA